MIKRDKRYLDANVFYLVYHWSLSTSSKLHKCHARYVHMFVCNVCTPCFGSMKTKRKKRRTKKQTKINDIFITYDLSLSMSIYMYQLWLALHIHSSNKHRFLLVVVVVVVFRRCLFTTTMRTCNSSITKCISTATPPSRYPEINKNKIYLLFICWMNICVCARCGTLPALWQRQYIDRSVI